MVATARMRGLILRAYRHLGVRINPSNHDNLVRQAARYLSVDREHFIELSNPEDPDPGAKIERGWVCRLVPLAQQVISNQRTDCTRKYCLTLYLLAAGKVALYVLGCSLQTLYSIDRQNSYDFPTYRVTDLQSVPKTLTVLPPDQIRPVATDRQRDHYGNIFVAFAKFVRDLPLNYIPHNTERAMWQLEHAQEVTLKVSGQACTGRLVPLARGGYTEFEVRPGLIRKSITEFCFMVTPTESFYLVHLRSRYLTCTKDGSEPCILKEHDTYSRIELDEIHTPLQPLYNN